MLTRWEMYIAGVSKNIPEDITEEELDRRDSEYHGNPQLRPFIPADLVGLLGLLIIIAGFISPGIVAFVPHMVALHYGAYNPDGWISAGMKGLN